MLKLLPLKPKVEMYRDYKDGDYIFTKTATSAVSGVKVRHIFNVKIGKNDYLHWDEAKLEDDIVVNKGHSLSLSQIRLATSMDIPIELLDKFNQTKEKMELPQYRLTRDFLTFKKGTLILSLKDRVTGFDDLYGTSTKDLYAPDQHWLPLFFKHQLKDDLFELIPEETKEEKAKKELAKIDSLLSDFDNLL